MYGTLRNTVIAACMLVLLPAMLLAQGHPMPGSSSEPLVLCTGCPSPNTGLPTFPYSTPLKKFAGRFVDSQETRDYQMAPRTYRARNVAIAPERDRVYMIIGSTMVGYKLSTFFSSKLGSPLSSVTGAFRDGLPSEQFLAFDAAFDAQSRDSGWATPLVDSQDRLYHFDWDDRGYVYLAYNAFGWGILQDSGTGFSSVKQMFLDESAGFVPQRIQAVKAGSKYYAIVGSNEVYTKSIIYDVTNPATPILVRGVNYGFLNYVKVKSGGDHDIAVIDAAGTVKIFKSSDLIVGGAPIATFAPVSGGRFNAVHTDGVNFYAVESKVTANPSISVITASGNSYSEVKNPIATGFRPLGVQYGSGYLTVWGFTADGNAPDLRLYKLENRVPRYLDTGGFFLKYYQRPPAGYAKPNGYTQTVKDAVVARADGKDYLIFSDHGLGDVFELEGGPSVDASINTSAGYGTPNPYSPTRSEGPFYGDKITFKSSSNTNGLRLRWNFANPQSTDNEVDATVGVSVSHQYAGLTNASQIAQTKGVTAVATTDPGVSDTVNVTLKVPVARIGVKDTPELFTGSVAGLKLVAGSQFTDSSDGSQESHYNVWNIDGVEFTSTPIDLRSTGLCGNHNLELAARYVPYTSSGGVVTPGMTLNSHYVVGVSGLSYTVNPFVAGIAIASSDAASITFKNDTRFAPSSFFNPAAAPTTVKWEHFDGAGTLVQTVTYPSVIGAADPFPLVKSSITAGSRLVLTVTMDGSNITEPSCATLLSSQSTYALRIPDPQIDKDNCTNVGNPCTLTGSSVSSGDQTGWTYQWKLDGVNKVTTRTYSPVFATPGTYVVTLVASNPIGATTVNRTLSVAAALCGQAPKNITIGWSGNTSNCNPCTTKEPIKFKANAFSYSFQTCDRFAWDFGDGTTSDLQTPPVHNYAANGPYTVRLVVTNSSGSTSATSQVKFGTAPPPPPPPPPCPSRAPSGLDISYTGATSGCRPLSGQCQISETIAFSPASLSYTIQSCDTFRWDFGDGGAATTRTANHAFSGAGPYTVRFTVTNSMGSFSKTTSLALVPGSGGGCPTVAPGGYPSADFVGATSGCTPGGSTGCSSGEQINFTAKVFSYNFQACDTFEWAFGDGQTGTGKQTSHTYAGVGPYTATLTVRNSKGTKTASSTVRFGSGGGGTPPQIDFTTSSSAPYANQSIQFNATVTNNVEVASWTWNFGDSTANGSGPSVTHAFNRAATFNVTVTATSVTGAVGSRTRPVLVTAAPPGYAFLLPVVAHLAGGNGSLWRTDLQIYNPDPAFNPAQPLELRFEYRGVSKTIQIDSSTKILEDFQRILVQGTANETRDDAFAVVVRGTSAVLPQLWTRTYNVSSTGVGTYGQLIPASLLGSNNDAVSGPPSYILAGLEANPAGQGRYRTNVGLVNPSLTPLEVKVIAYDQARRINDVPAVFTVAPLELVPINAVGSLVSSLGLPAGSKFSLRFETPANTSLIAYASTVDSVSNDPVYSGAVAEERVKLPAMRNQILPGIGRLGTWRSDVTIFNPDIEAVRYNLTYIYPDREGRPQVSQARDQILDPKGFVSYNDVVANGILQPAPVGDVLGILRIDTMSTATTKFPMVWGRTYNDQGASGTYGQGITPFAASVGNVKVNTPAFIPAVRQEEAVFYSNLGLVSLGEATTIVKVSFLDDISGAVVGIPEEFVLKQNESPIIPNVIRRFSPTASRGSLKIEVMYGGPVWAFASIIDKTTGDPEYVPAIPKN